MRDRLIELRRKAWVEWQQSAIAVDFEEYCADYLIANGVIVPPCKVGDTIYRCGIDGMVYEGEIEHIQIFPHRIVLIDENGYYFTEDDFDKKVFLYKASAQAALQKGGADNGI